MRVMNCLRRHKAGVFTLAVFLAVAALLGSGLSLPVRAAMRHYTAIPAPRQALLPAAAGQGRAVLAGGCFWGMEMVFQHVKGVQKVVSGYAGGRRATANYADTSSGRTRQAESVLIVYDPRQVSYGQLLRIYFSVAHDPTQVGRQGPDVGRQYRSEIFALDPTQQHQAQAYIRQLDKAGVFARPIATQVARIRSDQFYPAEDYHQDYGLRHPNALYIRINDQPKVRALAKHFPALFRSAPEPAAD